MKKRICAGVAFMFFVSGCAGSAPNPVARYTPADEKRNCASLKTEIKANKKEIAKKNTERTNKTFKNLGLGATGVFLIAPWFFMDLKGKEAGETEALERRNVTHFAASPSSRAATSRLPSSLIRENRKAGEKKK